MDKRDIFYFLNKILLSLVPVLFTLCTFIFIRTFNFGAEAERSYFLRFEPENFLNMFLKLCGLVFKYINADVKKKTTLLMLKNAPKYLS